jgi:hypothetical protein
MAKGDYAFTTTCAILAFATGKVTRSRGNSYVTWPSSLGWRASTKNIKGLFSRALFEVKREFIENDLDIHEEQLENKQTITVSGEEELVEVLSRWINNLNDLKGPSFSDYPI